MSQLREALTDAMLDYTAWDKRLGFDAINRIDRLEAIVRAVVKVSDEANKNGGKITLSHKCALFEMARREVCASVQRSET